MEVKDYYSILGIPSNASATMIKKAYHKMALATHPDKHPDNPNAIADFQLIHEAYTVLSTPSLKQAYLSQRWFFKSQNYAFHEPQHTPDAILSYLIKLSEEYRYKNIYQIDYDRLSDHLQTALSNNMFPDLKAAAYEKFQDAFSKTFLTLVELLPYKNSAPLIIKVMDLLPEEAASRTALKQLLNEKRKEALWGRYKYLFVFVMVFFFLLWMLFSR